ncbi:MAG: hypothetical protein HQM10_16470 [Candidatus Riflebacteria bacterium]|nr:hypothetical protein [Candidatus Riflebacteria bacterium]
MQTNTDIHKELFTLKPLFITLSLWIIIFFAVPAANNFLPEIPRHFSYFFTSLFLVVLSLSVVAGFSKLYLHRNFYLLICAVFMAMNFAAAKPLILRTNTISDCSKIPGAVILLTLAQTNEPAFHSAQTIELCNHIFFAVENFLTENFPEKAAGILLLSISQLGIAAGLGLWIGNGVDKAGHLIPVALVAALADAWSVSAGATSLIIRSSVIHHFLLRFPLIGKVPTEIPFLIGMADFLFFGLFYRASERFSLGLRKNTLLMGISFVFAIGTAIFFKVGIPVLPFMSVLFIAANWKHITLTKEETTQLGIFLLIAAAAAAAFTFFLHPQ